MTALLLVLLGPIVTGIIGNALVQRWQLRSWFAQQRQLGHQKELEELKELMDQLSMRAGGRLGAMRDLLAALQSSSRPYQEQLESYRNELKDWIRSLNSFYVRITFYASYDMTRRLEGEIQEYFVFAGRTLDRMVRQREAGVPVPPQEIAVAENALNILHGRIGNYVRDLLNLVEKRRSELMFGRKLSYSQSDLEKFTTLELVKALFSPNVDRLDIVRPA